MTEEEIMDAFIKAYNQFVPEKDEIITNIREMQQMLCSNEDLIREKEQLESEMGIGAQMTHQIISENARVAQDQAEYQKKYTELTERYNSIKSRYEEVLTAIKEKEAKIAGLNEFINGLNKMDGVVEEFDESLWGCMVEYVEVSRTKELKFMFRGGIEITIQR